MPIVKTIKLLLSFALLTTAANAEALRTATVEQGQLAD